MNEVMLRDYFIANAPKEPQDWFVPVMTTPRPVDSSRLPENMTPDEKKEYDDYHLVSPSKTPRMVEWSYSRARFRKEKEKWEAEYEKQRCVQWPAAWADEMIKARDKKGSE